MRAVRWAVAASDAVVRSPKAARRQRMLTFPRDLGAFTLVVGADGSVSMGTRTARREEVLSVRRALGRLDAAAGGSTARTKQTKQTK